MLEVLQVVSMRSMNVIPAAIWAGVRLCPGFRSRTSAPISAAMSRAILSLTLGSKKTVLMPASWPR